jgi:hypothetical protein
LSEHVGRVGVDDWKCWIVDEGREWSGS